MKLNNELLSHQKAAVEKLIKLKVGALFMEQGTGKSITSMEIARLRYEAGKIEAVIWLCPCSAKENIKREIIKQCPTELAEIFTICGIETLSTSVRANEYLLSLSGSRKCFLIIDESLLVKNHAAYRTVNISRISDRCRYKIILNGTPVSRNEADLFAQFKLLDWRILGYRSYWSFASNHLEYDDYGRIRQVLNTDYLAEKISPYTFQALKSECLNLPEKRNYTYGFRLTEKQNEIYDISAEILMRGIDERKPETIYRLFSGLQAIVSGKNIIFENENHFHTVEMFENPLDNPRIEALMDILPEDEKAIIYCRYESEISQLCKLIPRSVRFDGKTSLKERNKALDAFRSDKQFLIANKNCAGFSLNLQFCHKIIYLSNDWELGRRLQSEDRVHRIGQDHDVEIIDIFAQNTIDEKILDCLHRKERILDSIQNEIDNTESFKAGIRNIIYGKKRKATVLDCSDLEERGGKDA